MENQKLTVNKAGVKLDLIHGIPRIIGISGKIGSGKDTLEKKLRSEIGLRLLELMHNKIYHGGGCIKNLKFADALKMASAEITGTTKDDNYTSEGKGKIIERLGYSIGTFQQILGKLLRDHVHQDIWTMPIVSIIKKNPTWFCIITDCRFKNEAKIIHDLGGIIIRLNRDPSKISEESTAGRDLNHISETDLDDFPDFDLVIQNDWSIRDMTKKASDFILPPYD